MEIMKLKDILIVADTWKDLGGSLKIELGALEPLLWKDENSNIVDLVSILSERGFQVNLTSNGQLLYKFADDLLLAGLNKLRISWHTMDPMLFKEISGGYGDYNLFFKGINYALKIGLKVSFNRLLLKNYVNDIEEQISFIQDYGSRIKLYTLMWTAENSQYYNNFFIDWRPVIKSLKNIQKIEREHKIIGRPRLKFHLENNAFIEVKLSEVLNRTNHPCNSCLFKDKCEEAFGDYLRVDPNMLFYFCYLRKDISFSFNKNPNVKNLEEFILFNLGSQVIEEIPLRLTISPFCNFNCRIPGKEKGWCMEYDSKYKYPKIKNTII